MNFATAADLIRRDFKDLPGLELTIGQGVRLWNLGADDCRQVLDALVDAGFLRWTAKRTVVRAEDRRRPETPAAELSYKYVRQPAISDISLRRS